MKKIIGLVIIVTILFVGCSVNKTRTIDKLKYQPLNEIKIPDVVTHNLSNGMKVYFLVNEKLPIIQVEIQAHCGSVTDPIDKIGLAGIASSCITHSSQNYTVENLKQILTDNAISLYSYSMPRHSTVRMRCLSEDRDLAFNIFADVLTNPTFDEEEFQTEITRTISTVFRRNDAAQSIAFREFRKVIFGADYPYDYQQELYTLNSITQEDVRKFYSDYYYPKNMTLSITGDFNIDEMKKLLEDHFANWKSPLEYKKIDIPTPVNESDTNIFVIDQEDASQTWVLIGHRSNLLVKDDDYAAMVLLNSILGLGQNSRVHKSVRVDRGLSYSPGAFLAADYQDPGLLYLYAPTATENTLEVAKILVNELRLITNEKVTKQELALAKESFLNSFVFRYEQPENSLEYIKRYDYNGYDRNFANIIQQKIEKVTVDDVYRVARKHLKPDDLTYLFVGNKSGFIDEVTSLGKVEIVDISIKETRDDE